MHTPSPSPSYQADFSHSRTAEWFAVAGLESGLPALLDESESSPTNLREMWLDSIVDVAAVLTNKEVVPLGYDKIGGSRSCHCRTLVMKGMFTI